MTIYNYANERELLFQGNFRKLYDSLSKFINKDSEWYFLRGISAFNLGYYDEGEDLLKRARFMDPENTEYQEAYEHYINYRNGYNSRANYYNNNRQRMNNPGCCCCCCDCCGDSCCDTMCKLWCCDTCCECFGGDLITCL